MRSTVYLQYIYHIAGDDARVTADLQQTGHVYLHRMARVMARVFAIARLGYSRG